MNKKHTSILWKIPKEELIDKISKCTSLSQILKDYNLRAAGGNFNTLRKRLEYDNINIDHIPRGINSNNNRSFNRENKLSNEELFTINSSYSRNTIRRRLLNDSIIEYKCSICKGNPFWNDLNLTLILDHVNGIYNDHRLENLRFVCPNCNSQLDTHCGKNFKKHKQINKCIDCNTKILTSSNRCGKCYAFHRKLMNGFPKKEILERDIQERPMYLIGKKYKVSGATIKKWATDYNIQIPTKGFWNKKTVDTSEEV